MTSLLNIQFLDNSLLRWRLAIGVFVVAMFVLLVVRRFGMSRVSDAEKTAFLLDDARVELFSQTRRPIILIVALYAASSPTQALHVVQAG